MKAHATTSESKPDHFRLARAIHHHGETGDNYENREEKVDGEKSDENQDEADDPNAPIPILMFGIESVFRSLPFNHLNGGHSLYCSTKKLTNSKQRQIGGESIARLLS